MVAVTFVANDGAEQTIEIDDGVSAMEGAVRAGIDGIDGIDADCGGALSCATCHVRVAEDWLARLDPPSSEERDMLEFAVDADARSRLSCQIAITPALAGLVLTIPATQR